MNTDVLENLLDAKQVVDFEHTIAVLTDARPGLDMEAAQEIMAYTRTLGYYVREISVAEFMQKDLAITGAMLMIPHAQSVPIEMQDKLYDYWKQGGQVLLLGGALFGKMIRKVDGVYREVPLENGVLDAAHAMGDTFIIEGVAPTHKVFFEKDVARFMTEQDQSITTAEIVSEQPETVLCPVASPHGIGYGMEHRNRMIPIVTAMGEGGRAQGRRGAAAFFMLSNTRDRLCRTNAWRLGSVSATTTGSCIGVIGLTNQRLMQVAGFPELLRDMLAAMCRGVYLYEAGASKFVCGVGEKIRLGAKIYNITQDFKRVTLRIRVCKDGIEQAAFSRDMLANARAYTDFSEEYTTPSVGDYTIESELYMDGKRIDRIAQELRIPAARKASADEFVRVENGDFILQGKKFYPYGTNYWPLFYPSLERENYWMGWLDKANYDPLETERDLEQIASMRSNFICTRLDGDVFGREMDTLKDFIERARRHGLKLMISWVNATNPFFYQKEAVEEFFRISGIADDPTIFAHDISWETGNQPFGDSYIQYWDAAWRKWIPENYGSLENAEKDWGVPVDRDAAGRIVHPPLAELQDNGIWRKKICAYRRCIDHVVSKKWNVAVEHMRSLDANHLIAYRGGVMTKYGGMYLTATPKHVDFMALEGYTFEQNAEGQGGMICWSLLSKLLSGGKPVTWVEYGLSLIGLSGQSTWEAMQWDRENLAPYPEMLEEQRVYNKMFFDMFKEANVKGSAPWWYAGGFRRVELSDCGYVSPNGVPRPVWDEYRKMADWFLEERPEREVSEVITLDADTTSQSYGRFLLGSGMVDRMQRGIAKVKGIPLPEHPDWGEGAVACSEAMRSGRHIDFTTPGMGTTSLTMPMLAVGNVELNGTNPPKYLDAEFNQVYLIIHGKRIRVYDGMNIAVPMGACVEIAANVGNLKEAAWLKLNAGQRGNVCMKAHVDGESVCLPIEHDTEFLRDVDIHGTVLQAATKNAEVVLRMAAEGISEFGETMRILLTIQEGR